MKGILERKIDSKIFEEYVNCLMDDLAGKKVLIYGAGQAFEELNKRFDFKRMNVVAVSDLKFTDKTEFQGFKAIPPASIPECDFDVILMTLIYPVKALEYLQDKLGIQKEVRQVFEEIILQENEFIGYLDKIKFDKHLEKISKKLKNKKVVIYGSGVFFQAINAYYDLSKLNIIAISDRKYNEHNEGEMLLWYPVCSPSEIAEIKPDFVLVATRYFINIIEDLEDGVLKGTKIKARPLIKKPFKELWHEIWG